MRKKERQRRQLTQQLHIKSDRGATFVGCRPVIFASKKHPSRAKRKEIERSERASFPMRQDKKWSIQGLGPWDNYRVSRVHEPWNILMKGFPFGEPF